jgi:peptidyl-prolyl cis-trans isomerase B (cyclophilin B)
MKASSSEVSRYRREMPRPIVLVMSLSVLIAAGCGGGAATPRSGVFTLPPTPTPGGTATSTSTPPPSSSASTSASTAIVELEKGGSFTIALRPDKAPATVARFAAKAASGFYNGLTFHRVEDWVVQGGDPLSKTDPSRAGTGGDRVPSEYDDLSFKTGAVGIARGQDAAFNNDSQWFVVKKDSTFLDKQYTNFGQVTSGMDVVAKIAIGDKIKSITVK